MRSPCPTDALDQLAAGALPDAEAARVHAHLSTCPTCRLERRWRGPGLLARDLLDVLPRELNALRRERGRWPARTGWYDLARWGRALARKVGKQ